MFASTNILQEFNAAVAVLEAAIAENGVLIAANSSDIVGLASDVATNVSDIATNAAAIAAKGLVVKADQQSWDFQIGNFTTDYQWHDLDLTGIIPEGTIAVLLWVDYKTATANVELDFAKAGYTATYLRVVDFEPVANIGKGACVVMPVSADRKIQYRASNITWTRLNVSIAGWFL